MTTEMDWSHDFCLSCDRQISEGAYCSQACRLADIETASTELSSPLSFNSTSSSYGSSSNNTAYGFHLPPAVNFTAYKATSRMDSPPTSPRTYAPSRPSYFTQQQSSTSPGSNCNSPSTRSLTPSSSRSSLSSISSIPTSQGLSPKAAYELKGYVSSFDQVRESKRRLTR